MAKIFSLMGEILVDNTNANSAIDATTKKGKDQAKTFGEKFGDVTKTVGKVATAVVGTATAVVGGLTAMATKTAEYSGSILDASRKTSISTDMLQKLKYAGEQSGVSFEELTGSAVKFNKVFSDAATGNKANIKTFENLGIAIKDSSGKARSSSDVYNDVILKLAKMGDTAEANALGNDIFGKSFANLKPLLAEGEGGIEAFKQQASDLGIVMSETAITAGDNLGDTIDSVKASFGGIFNQLMGAIIPVLQPIINGIITNMPKISAFIGQLAPIITNLMSSLLPPLMQLAEQIFPIIFNLISQLLPTITEIVKSVLPILSQILMILLPPLMQIIEALLPPLMTILEALMPLIKPILDVLLMLTDLILVPLIKVISWLADILSNTLSRAFKNIQPIIDGLRKYFSGLIDFISGVFSGNWKKAWGGIVKIFSGIWDTMKAIFKAPINFIIDGLNAFIRMVNKIKIPDWVPAIGGKGINIPTIPRLKVGLDYVPYDDFPALLHRGERVMTANENSEYNKDNPINRSSSVINNFNIAKLEVKKDSDIQQIAEELFYLQKKAVV